MTIANEATVTTAKISTNQTRKYVRTDLPVAFFAGAQRRIVLTAISEQTQPASALDIADRCAELGLQSKTPVAASAAYHLHHLQILGYVKLSS